MQQLFGGQHEWHAFRRIHSNGAGARALLSFERPASAGHREGRVEQTRPSVRATGRRSCLSTVLENCTEATSAAIDKRRLKTGITGSEPDLASSWDLITVKIVRAHGGCLGT